MQKLVINPETGIIENRIIADDDFTLEGKILLADEPSANIGDIYREGAIVKPSQEPLSITHLADRLAACRYERENGGITLIGVPIKTDQFTRTNLIGARIRAMEDAGYTVNWKTDAGFVTLDAPTIIAIADAVANHVQKCFDAEAAVLPSLGQYETAEQVRAAFDAAYAE